eukprot:305809_1
MEQLCGNDDITQKLHFLANSFSDNIAMSSKTDQYEYEKIRNLLDNAYKMWLQNNISYNTKSNDYDNDLSSFWENVLHLNENDTEIIDYNNNCSFFYRDPVQPNEAPLREIQVCKELKSANKPILCELLCGNEPNNNTFEWSISSRIILKKGDDLRKDYAIVSIFKYMNYIWKMERDNKYSEYKHLSYENSIVK